MWELNLMVLQDLPPLHARSDPILRGNDLRTSHRSHGYDERDTQAINNIYLYVALTSDGPGPIVGICCPGLLESC